MAGDLLYWFGCEIQLFSAIFLGTCCKRGEKIVCGVEVEKGTKEEKRDR